MLSIDAWLDEKPYKELYDGVVREKVSRQLDHAKVQLAIAVALREWGRARGEVAIELRVYLAEGTTLVPDVAFITYERLTSLSKAERQKPPFAPDIAVEVRSPDDRERNIRRKTELYLTHGATLVLDVDPSMRTVLVTDSVSEKLLQPGDVLEHRAFPGLRLSVDELFADVES